MPKETIYTLSTYWVGKYTLCHFIQKLKHRRYQQTVTLRGDFYLFIYFVCFSYEVPSRGLPVAKGLMVATRTT